MLVLTRKQNEKIKIGDNITITVLRMKGKGVRLGIQAPNDMNVLRGELVFDLEEDSHFPETSHVESNTEALAVQAADSRPIKTSHQIRNSAPWSIDTHPNPKKDGAEKSVANCQPCWSI